MKSKVRMAFMKEILILQFFLILLFFSFCKDNKNEDNWKKTQIASLLAAQAHNANNTRLLTCSEALISDRIAAITDRYNQGCAQDSDCIVSTDWAIRGYADWGKSCYICIPYGQSVLKSKFELFKKDLITLNATACKGSQDMSFCNNGCPTLNADSPYCYQNKCIAIVGY